MVEVCVNLLRRFHHFRFHSTRHSSLLLMERPKPRPFETLLQKGHLGAALKAPRHPNPPVRNRRGVGADSECWWQLRTRGAEPLRLTIEQERRCDGPQRLKPWGSVGCWTRR